jgi:hypothetical protein
MLITATKADYNSILVGYWKAIDIEVEFLIVEPGDRFNMCMGWTHPVLVADTTEPVAVLMVGCKGRLLDLVPSKLFQNLEFQDVDKSHISQPQFRNYRQGDEREGRKWRRKPGSQ